MKDKNEFRKARYEYDELREALPEELNKVMDDCFDFLAPFVSYIYPVRDELKIVLRQLQREQFPQLNITDNPYLLQCIDDILDFDAEELSSGVHNELSDIEAGVNKEKDDEQFRWKVEHYAGLSEPRLRTIEDFQQFTLTYEEKVEMVNEINAEAIAECNELNSLKSEFVDVVQPILFKYHGERLNQLDTAGWERYAIVLGYGFSSYLENFGSLAYHLIHGHIEGNLGMNFFDYRVHLNQTKA